MEHGAETQDEKKKKNVSKFGSIRTRIAAEGLSGSNQGDSRSSINLGLQRFFFVFGEMTAVNLFRLVLF